MKLLLDTHVWLWLVTAPARLPPGFAAALSDAGNSLHVSVVSLWEASIKHRLGKLTLAIGFDELLREGLAGIGTLSVRAHHVARLHELPDHHRDPFDRMIVAQALAENLTLLTVDEAVAAYGVPSISQR